jgi:holin-like protein
MVYAFCIFICLQILGELIATALALPFPGALIGMLILLLWLLARSELPAPLASGADALHQHLGLFFVPVGVSLAANLETMKAQALILVFIILVSTWLSIAAIGLLAERMLCKSARDSPALSDEAAEQRP